MNDNTVVLITGCSSGIGFSTAIEFAKNGFVTYPTMRDLIKKNKLAEQLTNPENILELDVTNDASIDNTISQIENKHGKIDILVNNSGFGLFGSFEDTSIEEFKQQMETNFFGSIRLMKKTIPLMKKNKSGKIINISSVGGISGFPFMSSHISSAFALEGLTESLRFELKKFEKWFIDNSDELVLETTKEIHIEDERTTPKLWMCYLSAKGNAVKNFQIGLKHEVWGIPEKFAHNTQIKEIKKSFKGYFEKLVFIELPVIFQIPIERKYGMQKIIQM